MQHERVFIFFQFGWSSAMIVVLCGLARCVARNRVRTSSVIVAPVAPTKLPLRMTGNLTLTIGNPVLWQRAARIGDWKYLKILDNTFLFNVVDDPLERANMKEWRKDIYDQLVAAWNDWNAQMLPETATSFTDDFSGGHYADHIGLKPVSLEPDPELPGSLAAPGQWPTGWLVGSPDVLPDFAALQKNIAGRCRVARKQGGNNRNVQASIREAESR